MDEITLGRDEWIAVARELDSTYGASAPAGLRSRIRELLTQVPANWVDESCTLELDAGCAEVVRAIVRRGRGLPARPTLDRAHSEAVGAAEEIVHDHQHRHPPEEHRAGGDAPGDGLL